MKKQHFCAPFAGADFSGARKRDAWQLIVG
jgi:hypothetical protein